MSAALEELLPDYDPDNLDSEDLEGVSDEEFELVPTIPVEDMPETPPGEGDPDHVQDDIEGEGAPGAPGTIPPRRAGKAMLQLCADDAFSDFGLCLQKQRQQRGVAPKYADAKECYFAIPDVSTHRVTDWSKVPNFVLLYSPEHDHGHIMSHFTRGMAMTTDASAGHWGKVDADALAARWNYSGWFWSPIVNDVRIWSPNKPKPVRTFIETRGEWFDKEIRELAGKRKRLHERGEHARGRAVGNALRALLEVEKRRVIER